MTQTDKTRLSALAALFVAFPRQERDGTEKQLLDVYLIAVEGIEAEFVTEACLGFIRGQVERQSHTFRPTPPELAVEARERQHYHEIMARVSCRPPRPVEALPEPDVSPEVRARIGVEMQRLRDSLAGLHDHPVPVLPRPAPRGGVRLSPQAARHLDRVRATMDPAKAEP